MLLLDFEHARLSWITPEGYHGDWRVVAMAEHWAGDTDSVERFFLAPAVMAGNVFGPGSLPLTPPYSFQIVASAHQHVMIREAAAGAAREDSRASNETTFSRITLYAPVRRATLLDLHGLKPQEVHRAWPLCARITTRRVDGEWWTVQFPINHINSRGTGPNEIQVETGPLVLPHAWVPGTRAEQLGPFILCYVFFRRSYEIELLALADVESRGGRRRTYSSPERLADISVEIYGRSL